mmetsp:Transcript_37078/g.90450  ORF Transcript_37078/g.90450 Transcript_37078/m.90450 type:complete len:341 (+) Transcript_37078:35-1057(+)
MRLRASARRLPLSQLLHECTAADCQQELHKRSSQYVTLLRSVPLPVKLHTVRARMLAKAEEVQALAQKASTVADALRQAEDITNHAVDELRDFHEPPWTSTNHTMQSLMEWSFSELLAYRVLGQRHAELLPDANAGSLMVQADFPLDELLRDSIEDSRAFCREKFGDAPEVELKQLSEGASTLALALPAYIHFPLHELLKNSMGAHVRRIGPDRLDELPPIQVTFSVHDGWAGLEIADFGGGWKSPSGMEESALFLVTTNHGREPNYHYSRSFGSPFEGLGMGLPLAKLHARYLGGNLQLNSLPGVGARAFVVFDASGMRTDAVCNGQWVQRWTREPEEH